MTRAILPTLILIFALVQTVGAAALQVEQRYPVVGEGLQIRLIDHEAPTTLTLTAIYRPNSATEVKHPVGVFGQDGALVWKPNNPGITTLLVQGPDKKKVASKNVAVCYPSTPASGMVVMFLAGFLLFGGALYSLRNALKEKL